MFLSKLNRRNETKVMETKLTKEIKLALLQRTNQKIGTYGAFEVSFGSRYILEKKLKSDVTM